MPPVIAMFAFPAIVAAVAVLVEMNVPILTVEFEPGRARNVVVEVA